MVIKSLRGLVFGLSGRGRHNACLDGCRSSRTSIPRRDILGIKLTDQDVGSVPLLATYEYGNFIPGANGFPQLVDEDHDVIEPRDNPKGGTVMAVRLPVAASKG